jgi:hypothetical protein
LIACDRFERYFQDLRRAWVCSVGPMLVLDVSGWAWKASSTGSDNGKNDINPKRLMRD